MEEIKLPKIEDLKKNNAGTGGGIHPFCRNDAAQSTPLLFNQKPSSVGVVETNGKRFGRA